MIVLSDRPHLMSGVFYFPINTTPYSKMSPNVEKKFLEKI